jgi:hypothetical protein
MENGAAVADPDLPWNPAMNMTRIENLSGAYALLFASIIFAYFRGRRH